MARYEHQSSVSSFRSTDGGSSCTSMALTLQPPSPASSEDSMMEMELEYLFEPSAAAPGFGNLVIKYPVPGSRRAHLKAMKRNAQSLPPIFSPISVNFDEFIDPRGTQGVRLEGFHIRCVAQCSRPGQLTRETCQIDLGVGGEPDATILRFILGVGRVVGHSVTAVPCVMEYGLWQEMCEDKAYRPPRGSGSLSRPGTGGSRRSYDPSGASSFMSRSSGEAGAMGRLLFLGEHLPLEMRQSREDSFSSNLFRDITMPRNINISRDRLARSRLTLGGIRRQSSTSRESSLSAERGVSGGGNGLGESMPNGVHQVDQEAGRRPPSRLEVPGRRQRCRAFLSKAGHALKGLMGRS